MTKRIIFCLSLVTLGACKATVGVSGTVSVPKDAAQTCHKHCSDLGLELGAVAIMADNVGCVCNAQSRGGAVATSGVTSGMATIALLEAEEQQRQQQLQQQQAARK